MMYTLHKTSEINHIYERNNEATLYIANLDAQVDEETLCELFMQCGNVKNVHIPRDKVNGTHSGYGFVEYEYEYECDYAARILNMTKLYGKPLRCNKASQDKKMFDVGANLFIGNLDKEVDEKMLFDIFSAFGQVISVRIIRNEDDISKGHGFISYDNFESSDMAIENMNNQFISNKKVHVSYAYKKDTKGERHGTAAERFIAANKAMSLYSGNEHTNVNDNVNSHSTNNPHSMVNNASNNNNNNVNNFGSNNYPTLPPPPPPISAPNMAMPNRFNAHSNMNNSEMYMNNNYAQPNNSVEKMGNEPLAPTMKPVGAMGNMYYAPNMSQQVPTNYGIPTQFANVRQPNMYKTPLPSNQNMENRVYQNYSPNMPPNMPPNMISNVPPNMIPPNMVSQNMMAPNMPPHFGPTYSPNYMPNYSINYPSNFPPNFGLNCVPDMCPNYVQNLPPNIPTNIPPNMPPNMPHNVPPNIPPTIGMPNMSINIPPNLPPHIPTSIPSNLPTNAPLNTPHIPPAYVSSSFQSQQNNKPGNETNTNEENVTETTSSTSQPPASGPTVENV